MRGWAPPIGLEIPCNLIERTVERDLIPMAQTMGLGVICWSRWGRVLTGKYGRSGLEPSPDGGRPAASRSRRGTGSSRARAGHRRGGGGHRR